MINFLKIFLLLQGFFSEHICHNRHNLWFVKDGQMIDWIAAGKCWVGNGIKLLEIRMDWFQVDFFLKSFQFSNMIAYIRVDRI
jgi:hypothetical protein